MTFKFNQQAAFQSISNQVCQPFQKQIKMITFIDSLYKKYKVLKRLSQQESSKFQNQIILMLTDENQNVDIQVYNQTILKIGIQNFILQILSTVLKRNKLQNHYDLNKNLNTITKEIQKKQIESQKRKKEMDLKQEVFKKKQQNLMKSITSFANQQQNKFLQKICICENQMKKRINDMIIILKNKQRYLIQKNKQTKNSLKKIAQFQLKEKDIDVKLKQLQMKERDKKSRQNQISQLKKKVSDLNCQLNSYQAKNTKLQEQITKMLKKQKTSELAYKHLKYQTQKKISANINSTQIIQNLNMQLKKAQLQINELKVQNAKNIKVKNQIKNNNKTKWNNQDAFQLSNLQISQIDIKQIQKHHEFLSDRFQHKQMFENLKIYSQQQSSVIEQSPKSRKSKQKKSELKKSVIIQNNQISYIIDLPFLNDKQNKEQNLKVANLSKKLNQMVQQYSQCQNLKIENGSIMKIANQIQELSDSQSIIKKFLQILLIILEPCQCQNHKYCMAQLYDIRITDFIQHVYLKFQASSSQIQTNAIIILSRILLSAQNSFNGGESSLIQAKNKQKGKMQIKSQFQKGIKIRYLVEKDPFLKANMQYILDYDQN